LELQLGLGNRIQVVTDRYHVRDLPALVRRLDRQPDVSGHSQGGWSRADPHDRKGEPSARLAIDDPDALEVRADSEIAAETTRSWLERIAGDIVVYEIRVACEARGWPDADAPVGTREDPGMVLLSIRLS
jgi:hypothetical protein